MFRGVNKLSVMDGWVDGTTILVSNLTRANIYQPYSSLCNFLCLTQDILRFHGPYTVEVSGQAESPIPFHEVSRKADPDQLCFWHAYAQYLAEESGMLSLLKKFKVAPLVKESKTDNLCQHDEISAIIPCLWTSFLHGLHSSCDLVWHAKIWAPPCQAAIIDVLLIVWPF